ncbi:hypothetical protein AAE478_006997 [Parahypoxylon ruwenzoriense]
MAPTGGQHSSAGLNADLNKPSDFQVAASNSTVNTWFGGRQPSWLVNAKPVKPTPRPPQPQRQTTVAPHISHPIPTVTTTQPASVSVSAPTLTQAPPRRPRPAHSPLHLPVQTNPTIPAVDTVLPSPAPSDEPSPGVALLEPQNPLPVTEARFILDTAIDNPREEQVPNQVDMTCGQTGSRRGREASTTSRTSTPSNMVLNTPPTPNLHQFNSGAASQEQPEHPPAKRRRVGNRSLQLLESLHATQTLLSRLQSIGGEQNLEMQVERPRYQLLMEACKEGDLFFVVLHQLFCTWWSCQADVHRLCDERVHDLSLVDNAFGIMGTILKSNSKLRQEHAQWFTTFPAPLRNLQNDTRYSMTLRQVLNFLIRISHRWMIVHHDHQMNGYPLLVSELLESFLLFSPILQTIMFRASRRSLGVGDGRVAMRLEGIFKSDQRAHRNADGTYAPRAPTIEYQEYNNSLINGYKAVIIQAQSSQGLRQGGQQNTYTHMNPQGNLQMPHNSDQAAMFRPVLSLLPSNSTTDNVAGNQFLYSRSPINSPLNAPSPTTIGSPFIPVPPPSQFIVPSNHILPSNPATTALSPYPLLSQPINPNLQAQLNQPAIPTQLLASQMLQHPYQALGRRLSQQPPNPMGQYHGHYHSVHSSTQRVQSPQNFNGQTVPQHRFSNPVNQTPNHGSFAPNLTTTNIPPLPQPRQFINRVASPNLPPQPSVNPQPRHKAVLDDRDRFIPRHGLRIGMQEYPHTPYDKRSLENSLHQVHLRSPKRIPRELGPARSERHYQAVKCFALSPVAAPPQPYLHKFKFIISDVDHAKVAKDEMIPEHIFMELNGCTLSIMRKAHHSKDLPLEVSSFVVAGENILNISIPSGGSAFASLEPYIAVELVEVLSHTAVLQMVKAQGAVPPSTTRDIIRNRLAGSSSNAADDDELAMVNYLSIDLADPFTRTIFDVPVRGNACTHLECFDLETWLNTRLGKRSCYCGNGSDCAKCPKEPSFVDKWKCPLCNGDARPYSLRIDGFLVEVRAQLESEGKLRTKSILALAAGSWEPKEEPIGDESDGDSDGDGSALTEKKPTRSSVTPFQRERPQIEVIELDDD